MYYATGLPFWARGNTVQPWPGEFYGDPRIRGEYTPERELEALRAQSDIFQREIDVLNQRIRELEGIAEKKDNKS